VAASNHPIEGGVLPAPPGRLTFAGPALVATLLISVVVAAISYRYPPPSLPFLVLGGIAMVALLALALTRYDAAVALGFFLLAIVAVEPAPTDVVFAIVIVVAAVTGRFEVTRVPVAVLGALGMFLAINVLSVMEAIDPAIAGVYLMVTLYLAVFSIWLTGYLDSARRARIIVVAWLIAAVLSAGLGALAYFFPFPGWEAFIFGAGEEGGQRLKGLFADANVFAPFLIPMILVLMEETLTPRLIRLRPALKVACMIILTLGVVLAFSRAAWLNLAISITVLLIVMTMRRGGGRRAGTLFGIIVLAGVGIFATLTFTGQDEFLKQRAQVQRYDTSRFGAQRTGLAVAATHPMGIGPGQFELVSPVSAHSTYVRTLAEQGFLGFLSFFSLALITLMLAIRNALRGWSTYGIGSATLLGAWTGLLFNSFVIDTLHWRHLWVLAALIWAGAMAGVARSKTSKSSRTRA
jgi:O-antigen ligase